MEKLYDYTLNKYHAVNDEYDESWNLEGLEQNINTIFSISLQLANSNSRQIGMRTMNLEQLEMFNYPKNLPLKKSVIFFLKGVDTFDKRSNINFTYRQPTRDQLQTENWRESEGRALRVKAL